MTDFVLIDPPQCPYKDHIGALFTDVILQAGINYKHVVSPRVNKLLSEYPSAYSVNRFSAILQKRSIESILDWHDDEKQLRMVRIIEFCKIHNIQFSYQLKEFLLDNKENSRQFMQIKGIGKKTYDYLLKLLGNECVAVDRHIYKFVSDAGILYDDYSQVKSIVEYAADIMNVSRRSLDYSIWYYMSKTNVDKQQTIKFEW